MAITGKASAKSYRNFFAYTIKNFRLIPQIKHLSKEALREIEVVGSVLPFKVNKYVINELIDWDNIPDDPIYTLTFPKKEMLLPEHYRQIESLIINGASRQQIKEAADLIRNQLNPHPAGQIKHNIPSIADIKLWGIQHKYAETVLFFPHLGQTCHSYCTFCFRWPQFVGMKHLRFSANEISPLIDYLQQNQGVTDILFTGGDPLIMKASNLAKYIDPILESNLEHIRNIRIGTKALAFWPYRFFADSDSDELCKLFSKIVKHGKHLAIMAHFTHPVELSTSSVEKAISRLRDLGAQIRTQSPILKHINASPKAWTDMWQMQVSMGCIPYYMFIARNTGAQHFFSIPLVEAWNIFRQAYQQVSGICRTVRGPVMSCFPGKIQVLGVSNIHNQQVIALRMIQGRNPNWVAKPFFAEFDNKATWYTDLKPAFGEKHFFFESSLENIIQSQNNKSASEEFE